MSGAGSAAPPGGIVSNPNEGSRVQHRAVMTINGVTAEHAIEPRMLLVEYIRDVVGLTGTHVGCDTSQCGACTVMLDGETVKSCTMLALQADGSDVTTIEGVAVGGTLHPVQQAFWDSHALQCGYCTPGFIMSAIGLLREHPSPDAEIILQGLEGNLCRCTGYVNILRAVRAAAAVLSGAQPGEVVEDGGGVGGHRDP